MFQYGIAAVLFVAFLISAATAHSEYHMPIFWSVVGVLAALACCAIAYDKYTKEHQ